MNEILMSATINPDIRTGLIMKINDKITPKTANVSSHPHPLAPFLCSSTAPPIPQIDWNITQNPTKYESTIAITSGDIDIRMIPNNKSIIPLTKVHPQPLSVFLFDTANIISKTPLTKKVTENTIDNAVIVVHGDVKHQIPSIIASSPINNETHQYLTACFTE